MVTCPNCESDDIELAERLAGDARRLRCVACGHEWVRGAGPAARGKSARPAAPGVSERAVLFQDDDEGYLDWTHRHPAGFVINTTRPPAGGYLVLHRATCAPITTPAHPFSST